MNAEEFKEMPQFDQLSYLIWHDDGEMFHQCFDWESLTSADWAIWFIINADRIKDCHFERLEHRAWTGILSEYPTFLPEFLKHSKWDIFDGDDWLILLTHPEFVDFCDWSKLKFQEWKRLFSFTTKFADKCPFVDFDLIETEELLRLHPELTPYSGLNEPQIFYIQNDYPIKSEVGETPDIPFKSLPKLEDTAQSLKLYVTLKYFFGYSDLDAIKKKDEILRSYKTFVGIYEWYLAELNLKLLPKVFCDNSLPIRCSAEPFNEAIFRKTDKK